MKTSHEKNLKTTLFLIPAMVLLLCFSSIFLFSHLSIRHYLKLQTAQQMDDEFRLFDDYYENGHQIAFTGEYQEEEFILPTYFLILDDALRPVYPHEPFITEEERIRTKEIASNFRKNPTRFAKKAGTVTIRDKTYYLRSKQYYGLLDDSVILAPKGNPSAQTYTAVVYLNITPIQDFLDLLFQALSVLLFFCVSICTFILFRTALRIDTAFAKLKDYILSVGEKAVLSRNEPLTYREFDQMAETVFDLSSRIAKAEQTQKQFFQNASHELRTPLMSIQGYAEGIHIGVLKNPQASAAVILRESKKMSALVDDILFLSKMDVQAQPLHLETIDLKELLYDCSWSIESAATQRNIKLIHSFTEDKLPLCADELLLRRAFGNLLSNALQYAHSRIELHLYVHQQSVIIQIIDDGDGFDEKDQPHLFERFYKGPQGNFGIGLAITKDIITGHHGNITAERIDDVTVFTVTLPYPSI